MEQVPAADRPIPPSGPLDLREVRFPTRAESVLPEVLAALQARTPEAPCAVFTDGTTWSYAETAARTWGLAHRLAEVTGLARGEYLASCLPNGPEAILSWTATCALGAVYAPLNTAYRTPQLHHALELTRASVLVVHADLAERLAQLDPVTLPHLRHVVLVGGTAPEVPLPWPVSSWTEVATVNGAARPVLDPPLEPWDECAVLMTSGTTGASKAVRRTYAQYDRYTESSFRMVGVGAADRFHVCAPLFHGGADTPVYSMIQLGASFLVDTGFSVSRFWDTVRRHGCTVAWLHSAMSLFLHKQPERPDDADNPLRLALLAPLFPGYQDFARRFGISVYMVYGMTEMSCVFTVLDPTEVGSLGAPADPGYHARIVDEHDVEVPPGTPGELVVRHDLPWVITPGYLHDAAATARVWRNGWFHTGDVFVRTAAGDHRLVDRVKDAIRRRGEFVSAAEVERELLDLPEVTEAAVIGVAAEMEEEVLAYLAVRPGSDAPDIHRRLVQRLSYFAVPRYLVVRDTLPRNVALRVDKPSLRGLGVPADAWDAVAAGVQPTRERFGPA
ncbi:AMP-binding protein [Nakamurella alba]|uniref:AMP-binding protein n=1 Tax=Nakamurella alba TaxID=2665158 RepID=UPI0018AC4AB3|nr:AMP-binding protein [Nakamurella alba]